MPYIDDVSRKRLDKNPMEMYTPGDLNYNITQIIMTYVELHQELSYRVINDVIGAMEGAKLEFYRRIVVPYEDNKRMLNGDVY